MARIIWQGAISFSLIHIPVALHAASRSNTLDLDLLDRRDFSPVGYQRINKTTGKDVDWNDIVKGYQHEPGEYVALTDEDFRLANVEATKTIDIVSFVDPAEITPQYYDTPYYLAAQKRGEKVYALFRDVLTKARLVAIGSVVIRTRQYVCVVAPVGKTLLLNTLRYADEVLAPGDYAVEGGRGKTAPTRQELDMALQLVEQMKQHWQPQAFRDSYRDDLMKRIQHKIRAGETHQLTEKDEAEAPARPSAKVVDLTALLKQSLEAKRKGSVSAAPATRSKARPRSARRRSPSRARSRA